MQTLRVIILAAGKSTRMKSERSKILHRIAGREIITITINELLAGGVLAENIFLVVNDSLINEIKAIVPDQIKFCLQKELNGTAGAVEACRKELERFQGDIFILPGDAILFTASDLEEFYCFHLQNKSSLTLLSALYQEPLPDFGRIVRDSQGNVCEIVESSDASEEVKRINELNSGFYLVDSNLLWENIALISNNNKKGEFYLTDLVKIFWQKGLLVNSFITPRKEIAFGINSRRDLEFASTVIQERLKAFYRDQIGVTFLNPQSTYIEFDVQIGQDVLINPCCFLGRGTKIGRNCEIGACSVLKGVEIPDNTQLPPFSFIQKENWI